MRKLDELFNRIQQLDVDASQQSLNEMANILCQAIEEMQRIDRAFRDHLEHIERTSTQAMPNKV